MHSTMLSFSLNEAARRGAWTCGSCSTVPRTYQAWFTSSSRSLPVRSRRYSSSKPSSSPKDESRAITTPSTAPAKEAPAKEAPAKERSDQRRVNRRKSKDVGHESRGKSKDSSPPNMPSVPSTQNLKAQDIHIASFFSIHRPISVTSSFPLPSSTAAFSKIFSPSIYRKPQPADVIYTISSAVETFENATASVNHQSQQGPSGADSENELHGVITSPPVDGDPSQPHTLHINIEELARLFRPFVPPPPPAPVTEPSLVGKTSRKTKQKTYSTLVTVVERTHPDGQTTYQRIASPFREDSPSEQLFIEEGHSSHHQMPSRCPPPYQPFLTRMWTRRLAWEKSCRINLPGGGNSREVWRAISVRRQRKLKMKKHKYKKLMKRTKYLRRKLDRL